MAYLYRHIRLDKNQPFYIGIGSDSTYKRANSSKNRNKHWINIVKKASYNVEIVLDNLTWEEACIKEREFIQLYGRQDCNSGILCNYTDGGEGVLGLIVSDETKEKMRLAQTGKKQSPEQIAKRVAKLKGSGNPMYGRKFSDDYKKKLSKAKLGKKRDPKVMRHIHDCLKKSVTDGKIIYTSLSDAAVAYGVHQTTITRWINKEVKNFKYA
jgi:hypothetical protein